MHMITLILLWVYSQNTVGKNGDFQHLYAKISCKLYGHSYH